MKCYVPLTRKYPIPKGITLENTLFWPESGMTTLDKWNSSPPKDYNIITDEPIFVALYDNSDVLVWTGKRWENPEFQTYAADVYMIFNRIWKYNYSIPSGCISHKNITNCMGREIKK